MKLMKPSSYSVEGFASTVGGGNATPTAVSNTNDAGAGSLRAALEASGARVIRPSVSGTIDLLTDIAIDNGNMTYQGEYSPNGLQARNAAIKVRASDIIISNARFRPGDSAPNPDTADGITVTRNGSDISNIIFVNCSFAYSIDEIGNVWGSNNTDGVTNVTFAYCIFGYGLDDSTHSEGAHSKGFLAKEGWDNLSFHHNIIAFQKDRGPQLNGNVQQGNFELINNVLYPGIATGAGLPELTGDVRGDVIGNTYIYHRDVASRFSHEIDTSGVTSMANVYGSDNDVIFGGDRLPMVWENTPTASAIIHGNVTPQSATQGYLSTLAKAGAWPRDALDQEIVNHIIDVTGDIIDSQTESGVGGWPTL